tara:strand:- start:130 stop:381 length:252 start_codon:yes stop_codon:yes gene_type:complete
MSKEKELLEHCRMYLSSLGMFVEHSTLINKIDELLAQPERTSLTREEISYGFRTNDDAINAESFWAGVKWAEKKHMALEVGNE